MPHALIMHPANESLGPQIAIFKLVFVKGLRTAQKYNKITLTSLMVTLLKYFHRLLRHFVLTRLRSTVFTLM